MHDLCTDRARGSRALARAAELTVALASLLAGCGGGGGAGGGSHGTPGSELTKPGGGTFFLDEHQEGGAPRLHVVELTWGRLVDVHALLADGSVDPQPVFRELLIEESIQSDGLNYALEVNPISQRTRLIVRRVRGAPDDGRGTFESLLADTRDNLPPVLPHGESGGAGVVSLVPRNASISLRCDDLLADGEDEAAALVDVVRCASGYPPEAPFLARILFDPNHGGVVEESFHSTRLLIDFSVSSDESAASPYELPLNVLGLPPSLAGDARADISLRLPTRLDPERGIFTRLVNLAGAPLDARGGGPVDSATGDLVRAFRSGRSDDGNNGFLLDLNKPELIGSWPASVTSAFPDPSGAPGRQFVLDLAFATVCRRALAPGDVLVAGEFLLEPVEPTPEPASDGTLASVRMRLLNEEPLGSGAPLLGGALLQTVFSPSSVVPIGCWLTASPTASEPPTEGVQPETQFQVRFSEPMDPRSLDPFENLRLARGSASDPVLPDTIVVASVSAGPDLRTFRLTPLLPLAYGTSGDYHLDLAATDAGITDLAGNGLLAGPAPIPITLDPAAPRAANGGVVLRFSAVDELAPVGKDDLRGQVFYDLARGTIRGRTPFFESFPADPSNPVPSIMIPFLPGVQTPLSGLGSKMQTVWRYCDLGWFVEDETKHNLDVIGLSWAPAGGTVLSDFFERFEMRLATSRRQPDEARTFTGTFFPCSGLGAGERICFPCRTFVPFEDNVLVDPRSPQVLVHERSLGYRIVASELFEGISGTRLMPFPMNRAGGPFVSYTWRDTAVLAKDGAEGAGIPLKIETTAPLDIVPGQAGDLAPPGSVPAWGLPLLMEFRCYPSNSALGLNPLAILLAQNAQQLPVFRAFSTGGIDEGGNKVEIEPDLNLVPLGGFNPGSRPPGKPTAFQADNSFYVGQLDTVIRVSRCHTIWLDSLRPAPRYYPAIVAPRAEEQPTGTRVEIEFRGATGFSPTGELRAFDARELDPLGDLAQDEVLFLNGNGTWSSDPTTLSGARYLQARFSFVNDIQVGVFPELSAVGVAFDEP